MTLNDVRKAFKRTDVKKFVDFAKNTMVPDDNISISTQNLNIYAVALHQVIGSDSYTQLNIFFKDFKLIETYNHQTNGWMDSTYKDLSIARVI